jgi:hypothetical protein
MLIPKQQNWRTTTLPFSLALQNTVNTGVSWSSPSNAVRNSQWWAARGFQGLGQCPSGCSPGCRCKSGLGDLSFDGTGLLGTGLFSMDPSTPWGIPELVAGLIGAYAFYSMFMQTKQTKYRLEAGAQQRRKSKAARLRAKAKALEDRGLGGIFA